MSVVSVLFESSPLFCAAVFTLLYPLFICVFLFQVFRDKHNAHILPYISAKDNCKNLLIGILSILNFTI